MRQCYKYIRSTLDFFHFHDVSTNNNYHPQVCLVSKLKTLEDMKCDFADTL